MSESAETDPTPELQHELPPIFPPQGWGEWVVCALIVSSHLFDLIATAIGTPDLSREGNMLYRLLVRHGLGGWWWIVCLKVFAVAAQCCCYLYYRRRRYLSYPPAGRGLGTFIRAFTCGRLVSWWQASFDVRLAFTRAFWAALARFTAGLFAFTWPAAFYGGSRWFAPHLPPGRWLGAVVFTAVALFWTFASAYLDYKRRPAEETTGNPPQAL